MIGVSALQEAGEPERAISWPLATMEWQEGQEGLIASFGPNGAGAGKGEASVKPATTTRSDGTVPRS
jgi:hypothetical protein